jgi:hypothetical protein
MYLPRGIVAKLTVPWERQADLTRRKKAAFSRGGCSPASGMLLSGELGIYLAHHWRHAARRGSPTLYNVPGSSGTLAPGGAAMKLRVQREDGRIETLELYGTWVFREGKLLSRLVCETGCEYFFTPEGYYDGWGSYIAPNGSKGTPLVITATEEKREPD